MDVFMSLQKYRRKKIGTPNEEPEPEVELPQKKKQMSKLTTYELKKQTRNIQWKNQSSDPLAFKPLLVQRKEDELVKAWALTKKVEEIKPTKKMESTLVVKPGVKLSNYEK